ncbi:8790_t:CDS:2 [Ambispora leptoticha]|uniref:8790_t:CDS:1 n=1 Tax=Ambispora leptoticha TaxID=144679 RepID=A0A9N9GLT4_9GLOM|nr:8790_t:CDS:2 [Ambispora leptoticha]
MSNQTTGLLESAQELLEISGTLIMLGDRADYHQVVCKSLTDIVKQWQRKLLASVLNQKNDEAIANYIRVLREVTEYVKEVRKPGSFSHTALANLSRTVKSNNACITSVFLQYHKDLVKKIEKAIIHFIGSDKVMNETSNNVNSHKDIDTLILMMFLTKGVKIQDISIEVINVNPSYFEDLETVPVTEISKRFDWVKYAIEISKFNDNSNVSVEIKQKVFEELKKKKELFTGLECYFDVKAKIYREKRPTVPNDLNSDYKLIMESCWYQNPRVRPSIEVVHRELEGLLKTQSTKTPAIIMDEAYKSYDETSLSGFISVRQ